MAKFRAEDIDAVAARRFLRERGGLTHLRARSRADLLTVESGPEDDPVPHVRLRREGVHLWRLEMPTAGSRWNKTQHRGQRDDILRLVADAYPWMLERVI